MTVQCSLHVCYENIAKPPCQDTEILVEVYINAHVKALGDSHMRSDISSNLFSYKRVKAFALRFRAIFY